MAGGQQRITCWTVRNAFPRCAQTLEEGLGRLERAFRAMLRADTAEEANPKFAAVLGIILKIGNLLNQNTRFGNAAGVCARGPPPLLQDGRRPRQRVSVRPCMAVTAWLLHCAPGKGNKGESAMLVLHFI